MSQLADNREQQLEEREQAISIARAALRDERERLNAERAEAGRLLGEAKATQLDASRQRTRIKRLAKRFVRRLRHQHALASRLSDERMAALEEDRRLLAEKITRFEKAQSDFHGNTAAVQDRLNDAWTVIRTQQKRASQDWIETQHEFQEEQAILSGMAEDIARQGKILLDNRARIEAETAGFREEATSLEARIKNASMSLSELELRRDRVRDELLGTELPEELRRIADGNNLEDRERILTREKEAVAALKDSLERESADVNDNRRLVAEQLAMLTQARSKWRQAVQQSVIEIEQLARELVERESEFHVREQQLIRADVRRRDEIYSLWQLRLHLEAWQTKLTAYEMRCNTERQRVKADLDRRVSIVTRRETELAEIVANWEKARTSERERLQAELELWADDRKRLTNAADDFHRVRLELLDELAHHAARALASEELVAGAIQDSGSNWAKRRLTVLRKRWERVFDRKVKEIDRNGSEVAAERARLDERYRQLHALLVEVVQREAVAGNQEMVNIQNQRSTILELSQADSMTSKASEELLALRNEVERLSVMLLEIELPEHPEPPMIEDSWASEDSPTDEVLSFDPDAQAA